MNPRPQIVIVGAGFGGIAMAQALKGANVDVTVVDQHNYHNFQPLMYQVATGGLEPSSIAYPVRRIFRRQPNAHFRLAKVAHVDTTAHELITDIGAIPYDQLVVATGSQNNFFNFEPIKERMLTLKSIDDALRMRNTIFNKLERAIAEGDGEPAAERMNIALVGGGPAGLELAGALAEMRRYVLPRDFPEIDFAQMQINLYEASPQLLSAMTDEASNASAKFLTQLGINVHLGAAVTDYDGRCLTLADGSQFRTDTVIWTAGVKGAPLVGLPAEALVGGGRIAVDEFNRVRGLSDVFAIGDVATHMTDATPRGLPMLAPVAQQHGKHLAQNLLRQLEGKPMRPFAYKNKGTMATIGRNKAVVDLPHQSFHGAFAWFVWMFVHIMSLVGFRSKAVALVDWVAGYFTYDRPLGLIIGTERALRPMGVSPP